MRNFWLKRLRIGKRVRYNGPDPYLKDKSGYITWVAKNQYDQVIWIDVNFESLYYKRSLNSGCTKQVETLTVEPEFVKVI